MSAEAKVTHLELLLAQSNPLADAISLASLKSKGELIVVADKGRDILKDVAHTGGLVILKRLYESVPIVGRSPTEKLEDLTEEIDTSFVGQHEAELEMNLALVYTTLIHCKGYSLVEDRKKLIASANGKSKFFLGRMLFNLRSVLLYMDVASSVSEGEVKTTDTIVQHNLQSVSDLLWRAKDAARSYAPYYQFMTAFNLGRVEFLRGQNEGLTKEYFEQAHSLASKVGNTSFIELAQHHLTALKDNKQFGTVIDDSPQYKKTLMALVTEVLNPPENRVLGLPQNTIVNFNLRFDYTSSKI